MEHAGALNSAQLFKIWIDDMLRFPGLLAYADC